MYVSDITVYCLYQVGWDVLHQEFAHLADRDSKKKVSEHDEVFNRLKHAVIEASKSTHHWDSKAEESLVSYLSIHANTI